MESHFIRLFLAVGLIASGCSDPAPPPTQPPAVEDVPDVHAETTDEGPATDPGPDTAENKPCVGAGCPGQACLEDSDCQVGSCVWHMGGKVCSGPCGESCPDGFECIEDACLSETPMLCRPCNEDADCGSAPCLDYGAQGRFCGAPCSPEVPCPGGFFCDAGQCKSDTDTCTCSAASIALGDKTVCTITNDLGSCSGERTCGDAGLSTCSATEPSADVCDGVDNNCDGTVDEVPCNDDNTCTSDSCAATGCVFDPQVGQACEDGDSCTAEQGACDGGGVCVSEPIDCDDGDPCTADTCLPGQGCVSVDTMLCACEVDDDCPPPEDRCLGMVKCTTTDEKPWLHCVQDPETAVVCVLAPDANPQCQEAECIPSTGECVYPAINEGEPCDAMSACQVDPKCVAGVCLGAPIVCTDGDDCNGVEVCDPTTSECVVTPPPPGCPLEVDAGPDVAIELGASATLTATASGGDGSYSFYWSSPGEAELEGQVVEVSPTSSQTWTLEVQDGLGASATDKVTVQVLGVPLSLCDWPQIKFDPAGQTQPAAIWIFDELCTTAVQTKNAKPSVLLSDVDFESGTLTGAFHVDTTDDDDLIGFVFGYQSENDFYLMDWKQGGQDFCTADVFEGVSLKHVKTAGEPLVCVDFFESLGTDKTETLVKAQPPGWKDFVTYQWTLSINEDKVVHITIHEGEKKLHDITHTLEEFSGGKFGFYNNSQDSVIYEFFKFTGP